MYKIGWFSTGRDEAARDLLRAVWCSIEEGEIKAEISFVFSNRESRETAESDSFFELVRTYGIPLIPLSSQRLKTDFQRLRLGTHQIRRSKGLEATLKHGWRREYDRRVAANIEDLRPDLCVLAGYMLIVGEEMCQRYPMINLHPAAPSGPKGTWQEVIWQLMEAGAAETGAMMHLVTPQLDEGPAVTYCTFSIRGELFDGYWGEIKGRSIAEVKEQEGERNPLFREIRRYGLAREFPLIIATIKAFSEGMVRIETGRVVDNNGKEINGYNLTEEIERKNEPHLS